MLDNQAERVKVYLENIYDVPFEVRNYSSYGDSYFNIKPQNKYEELFDIQVILKNKLRLVIEVNPEKHGSFSIHDMSTASVEKKNIFAEYAQQLLIKKAKIDFHINNLPVSAEKPEEWPDSWENYKLRISRSPICAEDEEIDSVKIVTGWSGIVTGMMLSLLNVVNTNDESLMEGGVRRIEKNQYERNPVNRELCLAANGYTCKICGFDFEQFYGEIGHHFIHVHHIVPVSKMTEAYRIDPVKDLIPVCPNCHAMLHRFDPPLLPENLKQRLAEKS